MASPSICVFMGANGGVDPSFVETAKAFGRLLGKAGATMVYGGGSVGLMGATAHAALASGGKVAGYIPRRLVDMEVAMTGLDQLVVTEDMLERKRRMIEASDAFVALPGGIGTLDELLEVVTHKQLGYIDAPIGLLDHGGFWGPTLRAFESFVTNGFLQRHTVEDLIVEPEPEVLWGRIRTALG